MADAGRPTPAPSGGGLGADRMRARTRDRMHLAHERRFRRSRSWAACKKTSPTPSKPAPARIDQVQVEGVDEIADGDRRSDAPPGPSISPGPPLACRRALHDSRGRPRRERPCPRSASASRSALSARTALTMARGLATVSRHPHGAAPAGQPLRIGHGVADLAGVAGGAAVDRAVDHDAGSDAVGHVHRDEVTSSAPGSSRTPAVRRSSRRSLAGLGSRSALRARSRPDRAPTRRRTRRRRPIPRVILVCRWWQRPSR